MTTSPAAPPPPTSPPSPPRILGRFDGARKGPCVICVVGLHGNEQASLDAARRVLSNLDTIKRADFAGQFVVVCGNLVALEKGVRYIDEDLNRIWSTERIELTRQGKIPDDTSVEQRQLRELLDTFDDLFAQASDEVLMLDLHTASSPSVPFAFVGDTLRAREFARTIRIPIILGLEEQLDGGMLGFVNDCGPITLGVEGGQHEDPKSAEAMEAIIWMSLVAARNIRPQLIRDYDDMTERLAEMVKGVPPVMEVRYRHAIRAEDEFVMNPGFSTFDQVDEAQPIARDQAGDVISPERGRLLLPLYQSIGNDGFFLGREFSPAWLTLSAMMRRLRLDRMVHWLPGVSRHPQNRHALIINPHVARWFVFEIFHLLGYRKVRSEEDVLIVTRRRFDLTPPERFSLKA